jgi:hypothetical protein
MTVTKWYVYWDSSNHYCTIIGNNTIVTYGPTYTTIVNAFFNRFVQEVLQEAKYKGKTIEY